MLSLLEGIVEDLVVEVENGRYNTTVNDGRQIYGKVTRYLSSKPRLKLTILQNPPSFSPTN